MNSSHLVVFARQIRQMALGLGFHKVGIANLAHPPDLSGLNQWLAQGYQADMTWMENPKRGDPEQVLAGAQSLICLAMNYYQPIPHVEQKGIGKISRYAWGRDYHRILGKRLKSLCLWIDEQCLKNEILNSQTRWYVDTGPIAEKPWAMQAGLGWIGKNGLLLTREYGSWIFLGVILTTLDLPADFPHTSHCGTCTRCMVACPTGAIVRPQVVDANRCLAYHTLESHAEAFPSFIQKHLQGWVAGCDICQDVCPWNQRFAQPSDIPDFQPYPWNIAPSLPRLATLKTEEFDHQFPASALRRLKVKRMRRNAQAALQSEG
ncbi:MAG: tRNA epoxyqueuosine(34) reductase QueG [Cyanobacteriota bacterium]|nr:tRNA epoxyqueuosine(34) reductase QueG [Cyanobacteriota bacterium]